MRSDFAKVIVERPRGGSSLRNLKTRMPRIHSWDSETDDYSGPSRVSRRERWYSRSAKSQTDSLNPLTRFLHTQVGKPWNRVWSEVKHQFDERSTMQWHFVLHLKQMVKLNCFVGRGGMVYDSSLYHGSVFTRVDGFYVHPKTRTLEWAESWRSSHRECPEHPIILIAPNPNTECRRIRGIWRVLTYVHHDSEEIVSQRFDGLLGKLVPVRRKEQKDASRRYLVRQKQANRRELQEIKKYLAGASRLIKECGWRKLTIGRHPNLRVALLAKSAPSGNIACSGGELEAVRCLEDDYEQRQLGQRIASH